MSSPAINRVTTDCPACTTSGRQGSCARLRCYCGHPECWAYDSWVDVHAAPTPTGVRPPDERMARSWAEREEPTWLDR